MSNLKTAHVQFKDTKNNYYTSVNGNLSENEIKAYFVGKHFDLGVYPNENFCLCIRCTVSTNEAPAV